MGLQAHGSDVLPIWPRIGPGWPGVCILMVFFGCSTMIGGCRGMGLARVFGVPR